MWTWLNESEIGQAVFSYIKVFVAVVLGLFMADGADIFAVDSTDLRTWLAAGLAAVLPVLVNALNHNDGRYGTGASEAVAEVEVEVFNEEEYQGE